jgi:hypothetical protein
LFVHAFAFFKVNILQRQYHFIDVVQAPDNNSFPEDQQFVICWSIRDSYLLLFKRVLVTRFGSFGVSERLHKNSFEEHHKFKATAPARGGIVVCATGR